MNIPALRIESDVVRGLIMAGIFALAGVVIGILALPPAPKRVDPNAPGPDFTLLGQRVPLTKDANERSLQIGRASCRERV